MKTAYKIKHQDNDFIVVNSRGLIIAYCETNAQAMDVRDAQTRDDERHSVMMAFNVQEEMMVLMKEFRAEFM